MSKSIRIETRDEKVRKSLRFSIWDGSFYALMVGFGESFFGAFAVFLKASNVEIGLISALPQALGAIAQLYSTKLIAIFRNRKTPVLINAVLEGIMFIPIILSYFMGQYRVWFFLLFLCMYWIFRMLINPAWSSWMGDLVKPGERGKYFGKRNRFAGISSLIALLLSGLILFANRATNEYLGFVVIFAFAMAARMISSIFLSLKYDPGYTSVPGSSFTLWEFIKKARFNNYGLFVFFLTLMNFAVYLAAPFFSAYMLRDLKLDYITFTFIIAIPLVVKFFSTDLWGKACDRYGSRKILTMTSLLIAAVPIFWLFSKELWYLVLIQAFSGFVWAGFDIATFNFILDCTSTLKRATAVSYYNLLNGLAMLAGALAGGFIIRYNAFFWSKYYLAFLISFVARYAVAIIFVKRIHEMRHVQVATYKDVFVNMFPQAPHSSIQSKPIIIHEDPDRKKHKGL